MLPGESQTNTLFALAHASTAVLVENNEPKPVLPQLALWHMSALHRHSIHRQQLSQGLF